MDIADASTPRPVLDDAITGFGRPDVVVNRAGGPLRGTGRHGTARPVRRNFCAAANVLRAALPHLRAAKAGRVLQISSPAGQIGTPGMSACTAGRHALEGLSVSLAAELTPLSIRTTIVEPGAARTGFRANWASRLPGSPALPDYLPCTKHWRAPPTPRQGRAATRPYGPGPYRPRRHAEPPLCLPLRQRRPRRHRERPQRPTQRAAPIRAPERFHRPHKGNLTCPSTAPPAVSPSSPAAARAWAWPSPKPSPVTERT
ncbi:SDR family NAD(P)-dependent oxidoreductase [Streptomyces albofaciens]|uniref:SDR family NAD(P)-dependent oxidoreductase n=1 Tax=Streptomyces albofaciens TaxID=66866 RepID=UPI003CC75C58